jgi:hypothetical protein
VLDKDWFVEQTGFMSDFMNPNEARERSIRQAFEDGVEEIYVGLFMLVMSVIYLLYFNAPRGSTLWQVMSEGSTTIPWATVMALVAARKRIKAVYVFPRTGYVMFRTCKWRKQLLLGAGLSTLALGVAAIVWRSLLPSLADVAGLLTGIGFAACLLWGGVVYRFPHLNALAGLPLILGSVSYAIGARGVSSLWVAGGVGAALAVVGAVRFRIFLKTHPILNGAAHE